MCSSVAERLRLSRRIDKSVKTVHFDGLDHLLIAERPSARLFWVGMLLVSTTGVLYELYRVADNYHRTPVMTTMSSHLLGPDEGQLPDVEVCFPVTASQQSLNAMGLLPETAVVLSRIMTAGSFVEVERIFSPLTYHVHEGMPSRSSFEQAEIELFAKEYKFSYRQLMAILRATKRVFNYTDATNVYDTFMRMGFDAEDVFLECVMHELTRERYDCKQLVQEVLNPNFGKCFLVESSLFRQKLPGRGLTLLIDSQVSRYPISPLLMPKVAGIIISLHPRYHYDPYSYTQVDLAPGTFTKINLGLEYHQYISYRRGLQQQLCSPPDDLQLRVLSMNFTAAGCTIDCCQQLIQDMCQCYLAEDRRLLRERVKSTSRMCFLNDIHMCIMVSIERNKTAKQSLMACFSHCHKPCNFWKYQVQADSMKMFLPHMSYFADRDVPTGDLIRLDLAFGEMQQKDIRQQASVCVHSLISDIGGQAGLWLGGCMVTLIHITTVLGIAFGNYVVRATKALSRCWHKHRKERHLAQL